MSETSEVVRPILDALAKIPGVVAWRCQSGVVKVRGGFMHLAPEGTPDIIGFKEVTLQDTRVGESGTELVCVRYPFARFFGIECKLAGNRTKKARAEAQAAWGARLEQHGGIYIRALTIAEALHGLGLTGGG